MESTPARAALETDVRTCRTARGTRDFAAGCADAGNVVERLMNRREDVAGGVGGTEALG